MRTKRYMLQNPACKNWEAQISALSLARIQMSHTRCSWGQPSNPASHEFMTGVEKSFIQIRLQTSHTMTCSDRDDNKRSQELKVGGFGHSLKTQFSIIPSP
jgi:hypothetical protein